MNTYKRHRLPPDIISYSVWLYYRFNLSHRDIEDLLAERSMRRFKSVGQAQRFLGVHAAVQNLFDMTGGTEAVLRLLSAPVTGCA